MKQNIAKKILNGEENQERMEGLVSIIMPSYNTAPYIEETIQSVLNQTYTNWELIIVDDCSNDNTDEVLDAIKDNRIRYFKNEKNSGAAVSRNKALREAKGQWIAYLDSDDLWMPEKLEKQIKFEQFLATHHMVDFAWEIFKGVSPTLIALFTIWINTRICKKKTEKEIFTNETKELQTRLSEFASIIVETGEYLLEAIQNSDDEQKSDEMFDLFYAKNKYMLL